MEKKRINYITDVMTATDIDWMFNYTEGFKLVVAPTGTGKSTFIIENIIKPQFENKEHGFGEGKYQKFSSKNILVMANRTAVVLKFSSDVQKACEDMGIYKAKGVMVASYQKVSTEDMLKAIDEADIILCDEAHYFISDAWNGTTGIVVDKIVEAVKVKPVIFFTATPQLIKKYFNTKGLIYKEKDYSDVLGFNDRMDFVCTNKDLKQIIKGLNENEKALIFVADMTTRNNIMKMCESYKKNGYTSDYFHSVWAKSEFVEFTGKKDHEMEKKVTGLVIDKKFDVQVAFANKAIDNGIDIKDPDLKHIILLNQYDHVQILQMVGRKRFNINDTNDRLTVWFTTENDDTLNGFYSKMASQIRFINKFNMYRSENLEQIKQGFSVFPMYKDKTTKEIEQLANELILQSFFKEDENIQTAKDLKLKNIELIHNEEYVKLVSYQLEYLGPLVCKHLIEVNKQKTVKVSTDGQNTVRNYQKLVTELFKRPSTVEWRSKEEACKSKKVDTKGRINKELRPYLSSLEGITLMKDGKQDFRERISHYFGASSRADKTLQFDKINEFIGAYGYKLEDKRKTVNGKQQRFWILNKI